MALKRTGLITYNVHDRGRKARGVERHFDTAALAKLINGPSVQEKVRKGDMLGYLGHWPRLKFGMPTQEGGILDGKVVTLPLAIRMVHLSADEQGNITHEVEFLDTNEGQLAAKMYDSHAGGFSTAIDSVAGSKPSIPTEFHGADYVWEPNYDSNRGYRPMLDGIEDVSQARDTMEAMLDAATADQAHALELFDAVQVQLLAVTEALERATRENDLLVGRLAAGQLDGVGEGARVAPSRRVDPPDFASFKRMPLVPLQELGDAKGQDRSDEAVILRARGMKV
jgi:hypothetical protein